MFKYLSYYRLQRYRMLDIAVKFKVQVEYKTEIGIFIKDEVKFI